ncbi:MULTISPECIES: hypothetical protein [unclassified Mucilaginibacter]|uniref:hypothetical protein n=1 Tax=unclassified Mucilaginibacter TaxID=2617802 RepID=UPI0031F61DF3
MNTPLSKSAQLKQALNTLLIRYRQAPKGSMEKAMLLQSINLLKQVIAERKLHMRSQAQTDVNPHEAQLIHFFPISNQVVA